MLKLLFCKVADVFDRDRQFLFSATVTISTDGEAELRFSSDVPIEDMEVEGYVTFYDDVEGLVTFWCAFYNLRRDNRNNMIIMNTSVADMIDQVQRRQDLKTGVRFKIEVDYYDQKGRPRFCHAEVENISAGGVFFTSEHKFSLGDDIVLRLSEISPRLHANALLLRIQALDDWESSPWLIRAPKAAPPRPPKPEGQNIFSFVKKRRTAAAAEEPVAPEEPLTNPDPEPEKPRMAFEEAPDDFTTDDSGRIADEEYGGSTLRFGYGCQFKRIGQENEIAIRRFVFEQERLRLQATRF